MGGIGEGNITALWKIEPVTTEKKQCVEMMDTEGISWPVISVPFKGPHIQSPSRKYIHTYIPPKLIIRLKGRGNLSCDRTI